MPRPAGTPFWGESMPIGWTDTPTDYDPILLHFDGTSQTFATGEEMVLYFWGPNYLQAGDAAVCSWVFEVASGSGVLHVHDGADPTYAAGTAAATSDRGTVTVSGAGTYVLPAGPGITADMLAGLDAAAVLHAVVESGSIDVAQVKLRVWPPGGALGGYGDVLTNTPVAREPRVRRQYAYAEATSSTSDRFTAIDDAHGDAIIALGAATAGDVHDEPRDGATTWRVNLAGGGDSGGRSSGSMFTGEWAGYGSASAGRTWLETPPVNPTPVGVEGVDWIVPPAEVPDEPWLIVGDPELSWSGPVTLTLASHGGGGFAASYVGSAFYAFTSDPIPPPAFSETSRPWTPIVGGGTAFAAFADIGAARLDPQHVEVPLDLPTPSATTPVCLALWTDAARLPSSAYITIEEDFDGPSLVSIGGMGTGLTLNDPSDGALLTYLVQPAPFRQWLPDGAPEVTWIRRYNRDDGLGVSAPRLWGRTSRQRSVRKYGYR